MVNFCVKVAANKASRRAIAAGDMSMGEDMTMSRPGKRAGMDVLDARCVRL